MSDILGEFGSSFTIVESEGTATFAKHGDGTYWIIHRDEQLQLENYLGKNYTDNTVDNWKGVAVELGPEDGYRFLLQGEKDLSGQAYVWETNSEGVITGGSDNHTRWVHPLLKNEPITIAGKDGDDAKTYIEKEVNRKLEMLKNIENQES